MKKSTVNTLVAQFTVQMNEFKSKRDDAKRKTKSIAEDLKRNKQQMSEGHRYASNLQKAAEAKGTTDRWASICVGTIKMELDKISYNSKNSKKSLQTLQVEINQLTAKIKEVNSLLNEINPYKKEGA